MKLKFLLAASAAIGFCTSAQAQTASPQRPDGGLAGTTVVVSAYSDGTNGTLAQIAQMADASVLRKQIGAANGVAGLNASGAYAGSIWLVASTKAEILALTTPTEGEILNDSTDHVPVIYENGSWYPLTLGTALSQ